MGNIVDDSFKSKWTSISMISVFSKKFSDMSDIRRQAPYLNVAPVALELHLPTRNKKMSVSAETPPRFIIICPRVHGE